MAHTLLPFESRHLRPANDRVTQPSPPIFRWQPGSPSANIRVKRQSGGAQTRGECRDRDAQARPSGQVTSRQATRDHSAGGHFRSGGLRVGVRDSGIQPGPVEYT